MSQNQKIKSMNQSLLPKILDTNPRWELFKLADRKFSVRSPKGREVAIIPEMPYYMMRDLERMLNSIRSDDV